MKKTQGQKRESTVTTITIVSVVIFAIAGHLVSQAIFGSFYISPIVSLIIMGLALGVSKFISDFLRLFYVRESHSKLNEGFYTDSSWLDIENGMLVLLDDQSVSVAKFNDEKATRITEVYQANASHRELAALFEKINLTRIVFSNITLITSRHDENTICIEAEPLIRAEIEFLNNGTKTHAMERLERVLPAALHRTKSHRSRLASAMPRLVVLGILGAACAVHQHPGTWGVVGFLALFLVVPNLVRRLLDPTMVTKYTSELEANEEPIQDMDDDRMVA